MVLVSIGSLGAIIAEMWHTSRGHWAYSEEMQLPPLVDVGISQYYKLRFSPGLLI